MSVKFTPQGLRSITNTVIRAMGSTPNEAQVVSNHLVDANLTGHPSHGVGLLPTYIRALKGGFLHANQNITLIKEEGSIVLLNGNAGFGQEVARQACVKGMQIAKKHGVALMSLRNSFHIGRVGTYAEQCAAEGFVSIHFTSVAGHEPIVAPHGGRDARLGTNPVTIGLPFSGRGDGEPLILDFATSKLALGKVRVAFDKGETVPKGVLLDSNGDPTNDPAVMYQTPVGALVPMALHKGYGLCLMCEVLAAALCGGEGIHEQANAEQNRDNVINNLFSVIVDPNRLGADGLGAGIASEVRKACNWVRDSPPESAELFPMLPGDPERAHRAKCETDGVFLPVATWGSMCDAASTLDVDISAIDRTPQA